MRIFIACQVSQEIRQKIHEIKEQFPSLPMRWLDPDNLHVTLVPPMELSDGEVKSLVEKLRDHEKTEPFTLSFESIEAGPTPGEPRLVWLKAKDSEQLSLLKNNLEKLSGYRPDRKFSPHVTLARFKPEDRDKLPLDKLAIFVHWHMLIESFAVLKSQLLPAGAQYTVIQEYKLYE